MPPALTGGQAELSVDPTAIDFGRIATNRGAIRLLRLSNSGNADLSIDAVSGLELPFAELLSSALGPEACGNRPRLLQPQQSCLIGVQVNAAPPGSYSSSLQIATNAANSPRSVPVQAEIVQSYAVRGTVTGLGSQELVLLLNPGSEEGALVEADGAFEFNAQIDGTTFDITVEEQPDGLLCTVANGRGTIAGADVVNITVTCRPEGAYAVGGTVSGLVRPGLVLQLRPGSGNRVQLNTSGPFQFAPEPDGSPYDVVVEAQPQDQLCTVSSGQGVIAGANVSNVNVSCVQPRLQFNQTSLDFGDIRGSFEGSLTLEIRPENALGVRVESIDAIEAPFVRRSLSCALPAQIDTGSVCRLEIGLDGDAVPGSYVRTFFVRSNNAANSPAQITLRANVIADAGRLTTSPSSLDFGDINAPATLPLTLINSGESTLRVTGLSTGSTEFVVLERGQTDAKGGPVLCSDPPIQLSAGGSCDIRVRVQPGAALGEISGTLALANDGLSSPVLVPLRANIPSASLRLDQAVLNFGSVPVSAGEVRRVRLSSTGDAPLELLALEGLTAPFEVSPAADLGSEGCGPLPRTLQPQQSCLVGIRLATAAPGVYRSTLQIRSSAPSGITFLPVEALLVGVPAGPTLPEPKVVPAMSIVGTAITLLLVLSLGLIGLARMRQA